MKRKLLTILTSLALVAVLAVGLCGCSSYGSIKGKYEDANYKEIELTDEYKEQVAAFVGEDFVEKVSIHILQKQADNDKPLGGLASLSVVIIAEFKADQDLVDSLAERYGVENVENAYEELQKIDTINGNCVLILCTNVADLKLFKS